MPQSLFAAAAPTSEGFRVVAPRHEAEYAHLASLQLLSGKVDAAYTVASGGVVFAGGKKDSKKLREVWHGAAVGAAVTGPLPPPELLTPNSLLSLKASASHPLRVSKRDWRCLFDQLRLPLLLMPYWRGTAKRRIKKTKTNSDKDKLTRIPKIKTN